MAQLSQGVHKCVNKCNTIGLSQWLHRFGHWKLFQKYSFAEILIGVIEHGFNLFES